MRVAVVSDVHGGMRALEAVAADVATMAPDLVLHGGDLALSGPRPDAVVDWVREQGWPGVVGNTDELLWRPEEHAVQRASAPKLAPLLDVLFEVHAPATRELLGEERMQWLRTLPRKVSHGSIALVHASPGDLWKAPMPNAPDDALAEAYGDLGAKVAVYGHIHRPFVRRLPGLVVANSGSAGLSWDGDWRASYLLIEDDAVQVRRVEYDLQAELRDLATQGYPDSERLSEMRRTGRYVAPTRRSP
jgi:putative phosphoesterase